MKTTRIPMVWATLRRLLAIHLALVFLSLPLLAKEGAEAQEAVTTADVNIPVENLRVLLRPLTQDQLKH